jgi:predicted nucleic acid-binding protein
MSGMKRKTVSNAGPIIHLSEVNCFGAIEIFHTVVPKAVYNEVDQYGKPGSKELRESKIKVLELTEDEKVFAKRLCDLYRIEVGEAEAIAICIKRNYELFLTDDMDAREVGELHDIEVHGSLGIILRAYRDGIFEYERVKNVISDLYRKSSLFMTQRVYERVVRMLEKYREYEQNV